MVSVLPEVKLPALHVIHDVAPPSLYNLTSPHAVHLSPGAEDILTPAIERAAARAKARSTQSEHDVSTSATARRRLVVFSE